jgi:hypothetical protein
MIIIFSIFQILLFNQNNKQHFCVFGFWVFLLFRLLIWFLIAWFYNLNIIINLLNTLKLFFHNKRIIHLFRLEFTLKLLDFVFKLAYMRRRLRSSKSEDKIWRIKIIDLRRRLVLNHCLKYSSKIRLKFIKKCLFIWSFSLFIILINILFQIFI